MATNRIQEWAAEQWFNKPNTTTPITAERLDRIEQQVEGLTQDLNDNFLESAPEIQKIVRITQAAYDALTPKVATTLYVVVG